EKVEQNPPHGRSQANRKKRRLPTSDSETDSPRRPFNMAARAETARTRNLNACIRCRFQRVRCVPDPDDEHGPCLTCKRIKRPTLSSLPCLRYIITDSLLYREQSAPYQLFSKRWQTMDLVDITEWASAETKTIELTQVFLHAPF